MKIAIILTLTVPLWAGYNYRATVTVDKTKVPNTDQTNFPMLFCANGGTGTNCDSALGSLSVPGLKVTGSGGNVTDAQGDDIIFTTDTACASLLDWEIERYTGTTGEVIAWIRVPTLTTATDYVFYVCWGNSAVTTFQGNITGTWNSAFKGVYHYPDGSTLNVNDSTTNARNGTQVGTPPPNAIVGQNDGGWNNWGQGISGQAYTTVSDTGLPSGATDRTISVWFQNPTNTPSWSNGYLWSLGNFATANQCFSLTVRNLGTTVDLYDGTLNSFAFTFTNHVWYHIVATWKSSGTQGEVFVNGVSKGTWTNASQNTTLIGTFYIGETNPAVFNTPCECYLDELRISNVVRANDWIVTEYNNQSSPSTFYSIGSATPLGASNCVTGAAVGPCVVGS